MTRRAADPTRRLSPQRLGRCGTAAAAMAFGLLVLGPPASASAAATGPAPTAFEAALDPVVANGVTGAGAAWVTIEGDQALVQIQVQGLLDGAPHWQQLHLGAQGGCPRDPAMHQGRPSVSATDGLPSFGPAALSLTLTGGTDSQAALLQDVPASGSYTYVRTVPLAPEVRTALADGTAVLVVSGVDVNGNGRYDDVLGPSDLDPTVPAEATSPALCGRFAPMQMAGVPVGGAQTGGGSTSAGPAHDAAGSTPAGWAVVGVTAALWIAAAAGFRRWIGSLST